MVICDSPGATGSSRLHDLELEAERTHPFLFGFAKSERGNVEEDELATLRDIAKGWLEADAMALARAAADGLIQEVEYDNEEEA